MERTYPVFVPAEHIDEDEMEHSDVIDWCTQNLKSSSPNALFLNLDDVYLLQYKSQILDIINEENDGMLGEGEDDWILSSEVKLNILVRLTNYADTIGNGREMEILQGLLRLLDISLATKKNMYFIF